MLMRLEFKCMIWCIACEGVRGIVYGFRVSRFSREKVYGFLENGCLEGLSDYLNYRVVYFLYSIN